MNDLSSSVVVGSQFGQDESLLATMAKAIRILLLGPLLIAFSVFRRHAPAEGGTRFRLATHLPLFVVGYFVMFGMRVLGDTVVATEGLRTAGVWSALLEVNDLAVRVALVTVCAAIGLRIMFGPSSTWAGVPPSWRVRPGSRGQGSRWGYSWPSSMKPRLSVG